VVVGWVATGGGFLLWVCCVVVFFWCGWCGVGGGTRGLFVAFVFRNSVPGQARLALIISYRKSPRTDSREPGASPVESWSIPKRFDDDAAVVHLASAFG